MSQTFSFPLKTDPELLVAEAKQKAAEHGVSFIGNASSGEIKGMGVQAKYSFNDNVLHLTITEKPFFIPWSLIKTKLEAEAKKW